MPTVALLLCLGSWIWHSLLCHCRSPAVLPSSAAVERLRRSAAWFGVTKRYRPLTAAGTPGSPWLCHPGLALFSLIAVPPRGCAGRSGLHPLAAPPSQGSPHRDCAHMLRMVCSGLKAGTGAAVEFAWCLHYIVCSHTANAVLLSLGALPALTSLLLDMASEIPQGAPEGLELLVCPVLRCLSNLLAEETGCEGQIQDERLLIALFLILQSFFQQHPFIVQECLWLLNNLTGECPTAMSPELLLGPASIAGRSWLHRPLSETMILSMVPALADDPFFCSALLSLDLLPALLQLLPCSQMAGVLVLTVLCNVAEKGPTYCQQLHHQPALPLLLPTLALPDPEVVGQCLELLHLLFLHCPEVRAGDACPTIKPKVIKAGMGIIITIEMILPSAIATPAPVLSTQTHACLKGDTL
ncbi:transmembrane and coiled-coil domain-containing protein 6 isoform 5-T5 [Alca torda]